VTKILLAVDGSENAVRATGKLVEMLPSYKEAPQIDLVNVRHPVPFRGSLMGVVISHDMIEGYYNEEGQLALAPSAKVLDEAGVRYSPHVLVGDIPQTLVRHAHDSGCDMIYMGTRGLTAISNLVLGSVATKVLHLAEVPVVLVR
jgi:nucleotide-binding universal stress UspA family protein